MGELIDATQKERGALNYEWSIEEGSSRVHLYARYADADAAVEHLDTWGARAERFLAAAEITRFVVLGNLTPTLKEVVDALNPVYMTSIGGFTR